MGRVKFPLIVSNLRKTYKSDGEVVEALKGISFKVRKGETFGLLGPNGAGKTTTINILTGILTADSGKIRFFGKKPCEETQNRINTATAYRALNGILTVYQNLNIFAKIYNVKNSDEVIEELLRRFEIYELMNKRVYNLSSGERTRVNLCKSLINSPDLIFLDEATAGLDPDMAYKVRKEIKKLKTTIIFTSHIMSEVEQLCNRIAFLYKGRILKIDTPKKIKKLIKENIFIIEFLSQPRNADRIFRNLNIISRSKNKIAIEIKRTREIQEIIHRLITSKFRIRNFHIKTPTLEEVFIKIAKEEL